MKLKNWEEDLLLEAAQLRGLKRTLEQTLSSSSIKTQESKEAIEWCLRILRPVEETQSTKAKNMLIAYGLPLGDDGSS